MVLWKETAFPLCRATEKRWKRNVNCLPGVFRDSGDTPANLLCELNGHLMPCTSCLYGKWVEDVCTGQFGVFVYLVLCCLVGCCTWFSCCAANVGLTKCVWYCHVPGHWLYFGPWPLLLFENLARGLVHRYLTFIYKCQRWRNYDNGLEIDTTPASRLRSRYRRDNMRSNRNISGAAAATAGAASYSDTC